MKFTEFDFPENLQKGIDHAGFSDCTPVQEQTFGYIREKRDICAQSQTGTGKTAAFLISIFRLWESSETPPEERKALVVVPTRELAVQVLEEAELLGKFLPYKAGAFFGGTGYKEQEELLEQRLNLYVGTPGRLLDFAEKGSVLFKEMGILVLDEADRLFDMGFQQDIRRILEQCRPPKERLTMLFSATMGNSVGTLIWEFMNEPGEILVEPEQVTVDAISQELYHVESSKKFSLLVGLLKQENPQNVLFFVNTKNEAYHLTKRLRMNGISAESLNGDIPQNKRLEIIDRMKQGKIRYLVATDVAARGLHIENLALVVNYDLPEEAETYVHRIGRTARAGETGKAVSFACNKFVYGLDAIERYIEKKIPVAWADEELYAEVKPYADRRPYGDRRSSGRDFDRGRDFGERKGRRFSGDRRRSGGRRENGGYRSEDSFRRDRRSFGTDQESGDATKVRSASSRPARKPRREQSGDRRPEKYSGGGRERERSPRFSEKDGARRKDSQRRASSPQTSRASGGDRKNKVRYYQEKYGESFKLLPETNVSEEKGSLFSRAVRKFKTIFSKR